MIGSYWILPDRKQYGKSFTLKGEELKELREWLDLSKIPKEINFGIPEELLLTKRDEKFLFAQYARIDKHTNMLCLSILAGLDCNGRLITLTNVQIFSDSGYKIPPIEPKNLPDDEQNYVNLLQEISSNNQYLNNFLKCVDENPKFKTFSSEDLNSGEYKYDWTPKKKHNKKKYLVALVFLSIIYLLFLIISNK